MEENKNKEIIIETDPVTGVSAVTVTERYTTKTQEQAVELKKELEKEKKEKPAFFQSPNLKEEIVKEKKLRKLSSRISSKNFVGENAEGKLKWELEGGSILIAKNIYPETQMSRNSPSIQFLSPPRIRGNERFYKSLAYILKKENNLKIKNGELPSTTLIRTLKQLALDLGYNEKQLEVEGDIYERIKADLFSTGSTEFEFSNAMINGKMYEVYAGKLSPLFVFKPLKEKGEWIMQFTGFYEKFLLEGGNHFRVNAKALLDRNTSKKPYLTFFHFMVQSWNNISGKGIVNKKFKITRRVSKILEEDIVIGKKARGRPADSFKILSECIYYDATEYNSTRAILFLGRGKDRKISPVILPQRFKNWSYKDFKEEILAPLGLEDINEAVIEIRASNTFEEDKNKTNQEESIGEEERLMLEDKKVDYF